MLPGSGGNDALVVSDLCLAADNIGLMSTISAALGQAESPAASNRPHPVDCVVVMICAPILAACVLGIVLLLFTGNSPGHHDVVSYWTAAQQLLHHANPYDSAAILGPELAVGFPRDAQVMLMRNPPWALSLVLPLGLLGVRAGSLVWTLMLLGCLIASVRMLGEMMAAKSRQALGTQEGRMHLLGLAFGPALLCVLAGQSSLFVLLGLVLFLKLHGTRPYLAGSALYLCALKPHLFLPLGTGLLFWIVATQSYRLLLGFLATISAATLAAMAFDPMVWTHYFQMMQSSGIATEFISCPAVALRFLVDPRAVWLQSLPAALGCVWAGLYYWKNCAAWDWIQHGALLLVVSVVVCPYAWVTDQAVLLPALLAALLPPPARGSLRAATAWPLRTLMLASALIEVQQLCGVTLHSEWVLWTAPFWLAWFLIVSGRTPDAGTRSLEIAASS